MRPCPFNKDIVRFKLVNNTGQLNCFMNAVLQCVWNIDVFKKTIAQVRAKLNTVIEKSPEIAVLSEIIALFEEGQPKHYGLTDLQQHPLIDSNRLRRELFKCYYGG